MSRPVKRQPRMPVSVSLPQPMWVDANRAAGMLNMTLSEYCRAAIRDQNARVFAGDTLPPLKAAA